jgi:acetoacetyl-CoA synthetase
MRAAKLTAFTDWLARERGLRFADYDALWRWSVDDLEASGARVWDYFAIPCRDAAQPCLGERHDARRAVVPGVNR